MISNISLEVHRGVHALVGTTTVPYFYPVKVCVYRFRNSYYYHKIALLMEGYPPTPTI